MAVGSDRHDVLYANTELPRQINPRLYAEAIADFQRRGVPFYDIGLLMDPQADPVSSPMHESFPVTRSIDDLPSRPIHRLGGNPRADGGPRRPMGGMNELVDLACFVRGASARDGPSDVAVVAFHVTPKVQYDDVTLPYGCIVRMVVRLGPVRSGGHDGESGRAPQAKHLGGQDRSKFSLGDAWPASGDRRRKGRIGDPPSPAHEVEFGVIFGPHQPRKNRLARPEEGRGKRFLECQEVGGRHIVVYCDHRRPEVPVSTEVIDMSHRILAVPPSPNIGDTYAACLGRRKRRRDHPGPAARGKSEDQQAFAASFVHARQITEGHRGRHEHRVDPVSGEFAGKPVDTARNTWYGRHGTSMAPGKRLAPRDAGKLRP